MRTQTKKQPKKEKGNHTMKRLTKTLLALGCAYAITATSLFAQAIPIFTFDEFGNGTYNGTPLPSALSPDPSGGITTSPVLVYSLPFAAVNGDVLLTEGASPTNGLSDIVRFWTVAGANLQTYAIFYSDVSRTDPADSPADVGLPTQFINPVVIPEIGPEGTNGATYFAGPGMPGSDATGVQPQIQYNIISDVPEPGTVALLMGGLGILVGINRFRK
ncbi:MAG: PEP-CTERM sorting domain-containing protein [Verrucomicrobiota bacterium]